jgi:branched-chain amino acid transport system ATP-binding protein
MTASGALRLHNVSVRFGGLAAVSDASIEFAPGSINGLIGPNGAGKTTLLNAISGFAAVTAGRVELDGRDLAALTAAERARAGMVRGFQTVRLLERETVFDNVLVGCERFSQPGLFAQLFALPPQLRARARDLDATAAIMRQLGLAAAAERPVAELPFATRRLTEIARMLVVRPTVLLLDEPAAGLDTRDRHALTETLAAYHAADPFTMIVIEHDVDLVRRLCPRCVALEMGRVIAVGPPAEVLADPEVQRAYFGSGGHA